MNGTYNALHVEALVTPLHRIVKRFKNRSCSSLTGEDFHPLISIISLSNIYHSI